MKHPVFLALCGTVLFAAGYFFREPVSEHAATTGSNRPYPSYRETLGFDPDASVKTNGSNAGVRPFTPGRPFAKGNAKEWLSGLVASLGGDRRANWMAMQYLTTDFLTMDNGSAEEAFAALQEMIAAEDLKNPERRRNPNGDGKLDNLLSLSLMRVVQSNPDAAVEFLKREPNHNDGSTMALVFGKLAMDDPQRAEKMVSSFEKSQQRDALKAVLFTMVNRDPLAALALADRNPGLMGDRDRKGVFEGWVLKDPKPAMEAAVQAVKKSGDPELIRNTIEEWAKVDPAAAAQWVASYEGPGSVAARAMVLEKRAREEPQAVLQEYTALQKAGSDPKELARLTSALADSLAGKDIAGARQWAETLPEGDLRNRALHQVAEEWVKRDAPAASEWIKTLPQGELRDGAARELTSAIARRDPGAAFQWARSIENAKLRESALHGVMEHWREQDPDAAKAAMESLPAEMRPK